MRYKQFSISESAANENSENAPAQRDDGLTRRRVVVFIETRIFTRLIAGARIARR